MPEICEVEIIKEQLNNAIGGEHLLSYSVNKPLHKSDGKLLEIPCHKVTAIERWAKYLYFRMPGGIIESHLGMSGAWLMANTLELSYFIEEMEEQAATLAEKHIRYILNFTGSVSLIYYDARGFGSFYYYYCTEEDLYPTPDILNPKFDFKGLAIWNKDKPIYKYLHDQEIFPGMGAYLGAEWLFACNIHPMTSCSSIKDLPFLAKQLKKVLRWAMDTQGASFTNYYNAEGKTGGAQTEFRVYNREGLPCLTCNTNIEKISGKRGSQHCPSCQKVSLS